MRPSMAAARTASNDPADRSRSGYRDTGPEVPSGYADPRGCPTPWLQERTTDGSPEYRALPCGDRPCPVCGERWRLDTLAGILGQLEPHGATPHTTIVIFTTRPHAQSVMAWLRRHDRPRVRLPQLDGKAVVITVAGPVPSTWDTLLVEDIAPSVRDALLHLLEDVPVDEKVRVRTDGLTAEATEPAEPGVPDQREDVDDDGWGPVCWPALKYAREQGILELDNRGLPRRVRTNDPEHVAMLRALRSAVRPGRPLRVAA